jgi:nucleoid-associated protein
MPITLNYVTIHKLNKDKNKDIQRSNIREELFPTDDLSVIKLITNVSKLYGQKNNSAQYGVFVEGEGRGTFPDSFIEYYENNNIDDDDFHALSVDAMTSLFTSASSVNFATGGYIVFADYEAESGTRFLLIAMIKQKDGVSISGDLNIEQLQYIDDSKLYQAARINFSKYLEYINIPEVEVPDLNYLSFISPKGSSAGYFVKAIGCKSGSPSATATTKIVSETAKFFSENDELSPFKKEIKRDIVQYLHEVAASEVHLTAKLSQIEPLARQYIPANNVEQADQIIEDLHTRLNSDEVGIPSEFNVSKTALGKLTHISHKGDDFSINFKKNNLGTDAGNTFRFHNDTLIIKDLPYKLKEQILAQINDAEN